MTAKTPAKTETKPTLNVDRSGILQRKCDCGKSAGLTGQCSECQSKQFNKQHGSIVQTGSAPILHELIQPKLKVGKPGDKYEQEADHVADHILQMPEPGIRRQAIGAPISPPAPTQPTAEVPASVHAALASPGQSLDRATRAFMEPRFGYDFSKVQVHRDATAERSARDVSAHAYTVGQDIVFGAGRFAPQTQAGQRLLAHELTHVVQQQRAAPKLQRQLLPDPPPPAATHQVAFVREEGLNLREAPTQQSTSLTKLKFGQRVHTLEASQNGWQKVAILGQVGYVAANRLRFPPAPLIQRDPGLSLIRVKKGETSWSLVKRIYGIQGNESTKDQNINHFINAIRAFNKPEAFDIKTDTLDDIGNFFISGRDATDTYLKKGVDLWIPSFGAAAKMDVGSGTVRGEITRFIKKIEQKIADFRKACSLTSRFIPGAIAQHVGNTGVELLKGLIDFAKEAAIILAASTAVGALIGALFGGVGALPGAQIGFEIGLLILKIYGLYMLVEAILEIAGGLMSRLGQFIQLVWDANGDEKQLEKAAQALADALGILASAILIVLAARLMKKGGDAFRKTRFARTVGEKPLMQWLEKRQQLETSKDTFKQPRSPEPPRAKAPEDPQAPKPGEAQKPKANRVEIEQPSLDGKRKVQVTEDGRCRICASPCDLLRDKYRKELKQHPHLEQRIAETERSLNSKSNKAKQYREVEQQLADARATNRLNAEPKRLRDAYADELTDPANRPIKDRLDAAETITDPTLKRQALADIQRELTAARHPGKQAAYHGKKPPYTNPGHHDPTSPHFRGRGDTTTPLPKDAAEVYKTAIPDVDGRNWYGRNANGEFYRYQPNGGNDSGVHWNGREKSPRGLPVPTYVRKRFDQIK